VEAATKIKTEVRDFWLTRLKQHLKHDCISVKGGPPVNVHRISHI